VLIVLIFKVQGDGNAYLGEETDSGQKSFFINTYNNPRLVLDTGYSTDTGQETQHPTSEQKQET
jgi:hypothetical protein